MPLLYLIRHAQTVQQPELPAPQWPLSEEGFRAAGALAGRRFWPEIQRLITSGERKAIATAMPAAELWRLSIEQHAVFNEVQRGGYVDDYEEQVRRFFEEPTQAPAGWESADAARQRVVTALEELLHRYPQENLALVGHGLLWSLLRAHLLGQARVRFAEWRAIQMPDVAVWRHAAGQWTLLQDFEGIRRRK